MKNTYSAPSIKDLGTLKELTAKNHKRLRGKR